jgi:hypothetical protein
MNGRFKLASTLISPCDPESTAPIPGTDVDLLVGTWLNASFGAWTIGPSDIVPTLPALGTLPYFPELHGLCRRLFAPVPADGKAGEGRYTACYECVMDGGADKGDQVLYGVPFDVLLKADGSDMEVRGLSGAEEAGVDDLCALTFVRA